MKTLENFFKEVEGKGKIEMDDFIEQSKENQRYSSAFLLTLYGMYEDKYLIVKGDNWQTRFQGLPSGGNGDEKTTMH